MIEAKAVTDNNQVTVMGEIVREFSFSHEIFGEGFHMTSVKVQRISGSDDIIPVMVSERLLDVNADYKSMLISVDGQFRSHNYFDSRKNRVVLSVFAREINFVDEVVASPDTNKIYLDGYICRKPIYRKTPLGREIADLLLAVNRSYGKSDYIPCICWGRNARYANNLKVGDRCAVWGRIQSREYTKKLNDYAVENRVAYEVSVSRIGLLEGGEHE